MALTIELIPDPEQGGVTARLPDIPAYGEAESEEAAIADLREAIQGYIEVFGLRRCPARIYCRRSGRSSGIWPRPPVVTLSRLSAAGCFATLAMHTRRAQTGAPAPRVLQPHPSSAKVPTHERSLLPKPVCRADRRRELRQRHGNLQVRKDQAGPQRKALAEHPERSLIDFGIGENDEPAPENVRAVMAKEIHKPAEPGLRRQRHRDYKEAAAPLHARRNFAVSLSIPIKGNQSLHRFEDGAGHVAGRLHQPGRCDLDDRARLSGGGHAHSLLWRRSVLPAAAVGRERLFSRPGFDSWPTCCEPQPSCSC